MDGTGIDYFTSLWGIQREVLPPVTRAQVGKAYLVHIVGLEEEKLEDFLSHFGNVDEFVGNIHSGRKKGKEDYEKFWKSVSEVTGKYSQQDLEWLAENCDISGVRQMIILLTDTPETKVGILQRIQENMHAYK